MARILSVAAIIFLSGLLLAGQADARPGPPGLAVEDRPDDQGGVLIVTITASPDDGSGADDVIQYNVKRREPGKSWQFLRTVPAADQPQYAFEDTGLRNKLRYKYQVRASNGTLVSDPVRAAGVPRDDTAPRPPRRLTVEDHPGDHGSALDLRFVRSRDDGGGADDVRNYRVTRKELGGTFEEIATIRATDSDVYLRTDYGLTTGTTYVYRVRAYDGTRLSTHVEARGTPVDNKRPRPPGAVTVTDVPDDNGGAVTVAFRASPHDGGGPDDVQSYKVERKRAGGTFAFLRDVTATDAASYHFTDSGLDNNIVYTYRVRAFDGSFYSKAALGAGKALDNRPPKPPRQVTVTDVTGDNGGVVAVAFRASGHDGGGPDDVRSYKVERKRAGGTFAFLRNVTATDATSYRFTDSGLDDNTWYTYKVRAYDGRFYSDPAFGSGKALDDTPPRPPTNFSVAVAENALGAADVSFDASPDDVAGHREVTQYQVFRKLAGTDWPATPTLRVAATAAANYIVRDTGLVPGRKYWYQARAAGATGKSPYTAMRSIIAEDTRVPRPPRRLTAEDRPEDNGQAVILRWVKSLDDGENLENVARYVVLRRLTSVFDTPITRVRTVTATGAAAYTIVDTSSELMNLRSYTYTVRAVTSTGVRSNDSNEATVVPQDNIILAAPTNMAASDRPGDAGSIIQLQWDRSASETGIGPPPPPPFSLNSEEVAQTSGVYEVFRRQVGQSWPSTPRLSISTSVAGDPIITVDTGVPNGVAFEYKVRYRVDTVLSPFSNIARATAQNNTTTSVAAAQAALSVCIAEAPEVVAPGEPIRVRVSVDGDGLSQARLRWMVVGTEAWQQTAAINGSDSYEVTFTLAPAVQAGAEVRLVAVAENAETTVESEELPVRISD
jgi:hypothetical protein